MLVKSYSQACGTIHIGAQTLDHLQTDLISRARVWAVDEVGAAMAHQLSEPLTALLLYLHEMKQRGERLTETEKTPNPLHDMVKLALHETERVCSIIERLGLSFEAPLTADSAVECGREAIDSLTHGINAVRSGGSSVTPPLTIRHQLTPREREVLDLVVGGASNKEGGRQMGISTRTFEVHRAHVMEKLGARNTAELVRKALSEVR